MIQIDKQLIDDLFEKAEASERKRMNYDLRTSSGDGSQRMLNALLPGTVVPLHRHPMSNENVILLCGKLVEILYEEVSEPSAVSEGFKEFQKVKLVETERIHLDPSVGRSATKETLGLSKNFGCVVPAGVWHTVEVLEPSVIYEAKDGAYGEDGSETYEEYKKKIQNENLTKNTRGGILEGSSQAPQNPAENLTKNLKQQITYLIGMERHSGSMEVISPLYVSRMLNVPLEDVEKAMREMGI